MSDSDKLDVLISVYLIPDLAKQDFDAFVKGVENGKIDTNGIVRVSKDAQGEVTVEETGDHLGKKGATVGAGAGLVLGLFAPPLLAATAVGAGIGAVAGKFARKRLETGIGEKMDESLPPGSAGIIAIYEQADAGSKVVRDNVPAFYPVYIFEMKDVDLSDPTAAKGWYHVGAGIKTPVGWMEAKDILEWHNTLIVILSLTLQIPFALWLALQLSRKFRGRTVFRLLFFAPYVLSEATTGIVFQLLLYPDGMVDRALQTGGLGFLVHEWLAEGPGRWISPEVWEEKARTGNAPTCLPEEEEVYVPTLALVGIGGVRAQSGHRFIVGLHEPMLGNLQPELGKMIELIEKYTSNGNPLLSCAVGDLCNRLFVTLEARKQLPTAALAELEGYVKSINERLLSITLPQVAAPREDEKPALQRIQEALFANAGEREAEKRRQTIGAMFRWAISQDIVETDPTAGLKAYDPGTPRDRVLATRFGLKAADLVDAQRFGQMASLQGDRIVEVPLKDATAELKTVPPEWYNVAKAFFG